MKSSRLLSLILILCILSSAVVSAAETAPRIEANHTISAMPDHWNPLEEPTAEGQLILRLTAAELYSLSPEGDSLTPVLASAMPQDVTAEFAGQHGVPTDAARGYAFRILLDPAAKWDDGSPITAADFLFTFRALIEQNTFPLDLAFLQEYYSGAQKGDDTVVSLRDAGFSSVEEAEDAGYSLFFVDTTHFWGLTAGWVSAGDYTRLKDAAIPSGVTEMYVSGAYLYDRYLRTGRDTDMFQKEFVGICPQTEYVTLADIGLVEEDGGFVLILSHPTAPEYVALRLTDLYPVRESIYDGSYATTHTAYPSSGPYRIVSVTDNALVMEPNPHWLGKQEAFRADLIRLEIGA